MQDAQPAASSATLDAMVAAVRQLDADLSARLTYCEHWIGGAVILVGFVLVILTAGLIRGRG